MVVMDSREGDWRRRRVFRRRRWVVEEKIRVGDGGDG